MSCPGCESDRAPKPHRVLEEGALGRCRTCHLVYVDPMPTREDALALYDAHYFKDPERGYVDYVADEAVYRKEFRRRLRTLHKAGAQGRLLDVGCAAGWLLDEAKSLDFEPTGLEPSPQVAREAHERTGVPVFAGAVEDALLSTAHYDAITIFDVLEHLVEPLATLRRLRCAMRSGAYLAVTVPDYGGWWARLSGKRWPFLTPWEHLTYFTRRTLRGILIRAGFESVQFHRAGTPLSVRTMKAKAPAARWLPFHPARGGSLPAGTLYAIARAPVL